MADKSIQYRSKQVSALTNSKGVYALCDLDEVPARWRGHRHTISLLSGDDFHRGGRANECPRLSETGAISGENPRTQKKSFLSECARLRAHCWAHKPVLQRADGQGFEPWVPFGYTRFPGVHNRPLCHPSIKSHPSPGRGEGDCCAKPLPLQELICNTDKILQRKSRIIGHRRGLFS